MTKNELIDRISKARINANLSARALSQMVDMNDGYISRLESKKDFLPSAEVLLAIIEACGLTEEQFFIMICSAMTKTPNLFACLQGSVQRKKTPLFRLSRMTISVFSTWRTCSIYLTKMRMLTA